MATVIPLPAPPRVRVRWKIFAFMFLFGVFAYLQQKGLAVAALRMMPELGLTQQQIGWLQAAFIAGYSLMQFPGGLLGQRFRPRLVFAVLGFGACAAALVVPLAPLVRLHPVDFPRTALRAVVRIDARDLVHDRDVAGKVSAQVSQARGGC